MKKIDKWINEIGDYFISIDPGSDLDSSYEKLRKAYDYTSVVDYTKYSTWLTKEETPEKEKIKTLNESRLKEIKP
jgi:hypothetical protein